MLCYLFRKTENVYSRSILMALLIIDDVSKFIKQLFFKFHILRSVLFPSYVLRECRSVVMFECNRPPCGAADKPPSSSSSLHVAAAADGSSDVNHRRRIVFNQPIGPVRSRSTPGNYISLSLCDLGPSVPVFIMLSRDGHRVLGVELYDDHLSPSGESRHSHICVLSLRGSSSRPPRDHAYLLAFRCLIVTDVRPNTIMHS